MTPYQRVNLFLAPSSTQGIGVFTAEPIKTGQVVEVCPVLRFNEKYQEIRDYLFNWDECYVLAMGYGSLYNHSVDSNINHESRRDEGLMVFTALRPIAPNEELFINYGEGWFASRPYREVQPARRETLLNKVVFPIMYSLALLFAAILAFIYL